MHATPFRRRYRVTITLVIFTVITIINNINHITTAFAFRNRRRMSSSLARVWMTSSRARPLRPSVMMSMTRHHRLLATRMLSSSSPYNNNKIRLSLTENEHKLFDWLKQVVEEKQLNTTVRVAGGWVRDRVLGLPGKDDVDIALDNMTGLEFVSVLNSWNEEHGINKVKFGIIQQNPDKSKHLETVSLQCDNLSVDFVNLRTESYTNSSRIPLVAIGTPIEDAYRRDLTINSLFYNIHTEEIEDFTGQGLTDLQQQVIRTPLEPWVTLTDDPLRALRALRFGCRFNFTIAKELMHVICQDAGGEASRGEKGERVCVHELLLQKVSRERIAVEIELMLKTSQFSRAWFILYQSKLLNTILPLPTRLLLRKPTSTSLSSPVSPSLSTPVSPVSSLSPLTAGKSKRQQQQVQVPVQGVSQRHNETMLDSHYLLSYDLLSQDHPLVHSLHSQFHAMSVLSVLLSQYLYTKHYHPSSSSSTPSLSRHVSQTINQTFEHFDIKRTFMFGLALLPTMGFYALPDNGKSKVTHLSVVLLKHSLKLSQRDYRLMDTLLQHLPPFIDFLQRIDVNTHGGEREGHRGSVYNMNGESQSFMQTKDKSELLSNVVGGDAINGLSRLEVGLAMDSVGVTHYPQVLLLAAMKIAMEDMMKNKSDGAAPTTASASAYWIEKLAKYLHLSYERQQQTSVLVLEDKEGFEEDSELKLLDQELRQILGKVDYLFQVMEILQLNQQHWPLRHLVDGHELLQIFPKLSKGSVVGEMLLIQKKWILCNPQGTKDQFVDFMKCRFHHLL